jgi:phage-related minor tail protein
MRGMQQGLADFLFDPFEEGLDGMLKGFLDTMRRMVAELLAQELLTSFFGTALGGGVKGFFGGLAGRASGGPVSAGVPYMVGERGKETFVPSTSGYIVPNGGGGSVAVTNHITINDETDLKRSMPAIAAEITRQSVASAKSEMKNDIRRYGRVR